MILETGTRTLRCIREVIRGKVNDVFVCEDRQEGVLKYHTLWMVKNRKTAKMLLAGWKACECFAYEEKLCFLLPYEKERSLERFYAGTVQKGQVSGESIWEALTAGCMTSRIPYPLLSLILEQGQVSLEKDGSIHFGYLIDLEEYDSQVTEEACAVKCARLLITLMEQEGKRAAGKTLLERKVEKGEYQGFTQLYQDVKVLAQSSGRKKGKYSFQKKQQIYTRLFHILKLICILLLILAGILFLTNLLLGDGALFRLLAPSIKQIGTESLLQ